MALSPMLYTLTSVESWSGQTKPLLGSMLHPLTTITIH